MSVGPLCLLPVRWFDGVLCDLICCTLNSFLPPQNGYCFRHYYLHESLRVEEENKAAQQRKAQQSERNEEAGAIDMVAKIASVLSVLSPNALSPPITTQPCLLSLLVSLSL